MSKLLLIGGAGQLGVEVQRQAASAGFELFAPGREQLDLGDAESIRAAVESEPWSCVINSAAFTAVSRRWHTACQRGDTRGLSQDGERDGHREPCHDRQDQAPAPPRDGRGHDRSEQHRHP